MTSAKKVKNLDSPPTYTQKSSFGLATLTSLGRPQSAMVQLHKGFFGFSSKNSTMTFKHLCKKFFFDDANNIFNSQKYFANERKAVRHYLSRRSWKVGQRSMSLIQK